MTKRTRWGRDYVAYASGQTNVAAGAEHVDGGRHVEDRRAACAQNKKSEKYTSLLDKYLCPKRSITINNNNFNYNNR